MATLEETRVAILGKNGELTAQLKQLGSMEPEARKTFGQTINQIKEEVQTAIEARSAELHRKEMEARLIKERIDVSQSARPRQSGKVHPITQTIDEIIAIFGQMGFSWAEGPEIETDWYNFTAMNMPADHAARQCKIHFTWQGIRGMKVLSFYAPIPAPSKRARC